MALILHFLLEKPPMNMQRPTLVLLCVAVLSTFGVAARAQTSSTATTATNTESPRLASRYTTFAGSATNADALVSGLRNGTSITLDTTTTTKNPDGTTSTTTTPTSFQPATGKLGYGNVNIVLALAQDELAKMGITDPTAAEIEAALNGGTVMLADGSTQDLQGILALRAQGQGWGQIAQTLGFKLGDVVSASENGHSAAAAEHGQHGNDVASANRPTHPDHPQRPDRPQRPDIPSHAGRPGH
jgi:hypothetical protein